VNIGADTTEISLISLGGIVQSRLLKIGGTKFDEAIQQAVKKKHNLVIGMKSAERLKMQLASGTEEEEDITSDVMGRNLITGLPSRVVVTNHLVFEAMSECMSSIIDSIKFILEKTPPELSMDIMHEGICMTGGSTYIKNLDNLIRQETGLTIMKVEEPELTVVRGLGMIMENPTYERMAYNLQESDFQ
jgi:rod shape-determining protein MreB